MTSIRDELDPLGGTDVGDLYIYTAAEAREEFDYVGWGRAAAVGLVPFAMAPNGDVWALDPAAELEVVLLSHDHFWDRKALSSGEGVVRLGVGLEAALDLARRGHLPIDYWEAVERLKRGQDVVQPPA